MAFERTIDGEAVEFRTSGKLYNANLVMYDRKTDTYWSQLDGLAIVGELTGKKLTPISIDTVTWRGWKEEHFDSEVLSRDTGFSKPYGRDPYPGYYESTFVPFPLENTDDAVHPKTVVFGIEVSGVYKAYKETDLEKLGMIEDTIDGVEIRVNRESSGTVKVTEIESGKEIVSVRGFWFAWYAFHPETELYLK